MKAFAFYVGFVSSFCLAQSIFAADQLPDIRRRCLNDNLDYNQAVGRNTWAKNCGYIQQRDFEKLMKVSPLEYISFSQNAPTDPMAPCGVYTKASLCYTGCFDSSQNVLFGHHYFPIEQGARTGKKQITALAEGSDINNITLAQEDIQFFLQGEEHSNLFIITGSHGRQLRVTSNHPVFDATGFIHRVDSIKIGDWLLTADGSTQVTNIKIQAYHGPVWSINPVSSAAKANTNIAEGFITGSVRFQNDWAHEDFRYLLRMRIDIKDL